MSKFSNSVKSHRLFFINLTGASVPWGGTNGSVDGNSRTKYKALYDFVATREDELSLVLGQEIWVRGHYNDNTCLVQNQNMYLNTRGGNGFGK